MLSSPLVKKRDQFSRFSRIVNKLSSGNLEDVQFIRSIVRQAFESYNEPLRDESTSFIHPHYKKIRNLQKLSIAPPESIAERFKFREYDDQRQKDEYHEKEKLKRHPESCDCNMCKEERGEKERVRTVLAPNPMHETGASQAEQQYGLSIANVINIQKKKFSFLNEGTDAFAVISPIIMEILNSAGPKLTSEKLKGVLDTVASKDPPAQKVLTDPDAVDKLATGNDMMVAIQKFFNHSGFMPTIFIKHFKDAMEELHDHLENPEEDKGTVEEQDISDPARDSSKSNPVEVEGGKQPTPPAITGLNL